jgi:tetratricopeptide (TPR) repeat protein
MNYPVFNSGSKLDSLLMKVFQAYREGLRVKHQSHSPMPPRDFDALKFLGTVGWVPLGERLQLHNLHIACSKGLTAARQGRLDDALAYYEQAREHLDLLQDDLRLGWFLGVSTYQAGVAYLNFRSGCIERACECLDLAMDADLELERAGLPVMQMHRIQQGHNLVRMDVRLGRRQVAVGRAGLLLAYMERRTAVLPYHHDWLSKSLQAVPRSIIRSMIHQIIGETAGFIVTGDAAAKEWQELIKASLLYRDPENAVLPQMQYALWAQYDRLEGNPEGYLCNLDRFFSFGIRQCHLLWYAVMVEVVGFCGHLNTSLARQVRDVIVRDSVKWKGLPLFLRARLDGV